MQVEKPSISRKQPPEYFYAIVGVISTLGFLWLAGWLLLKLVTALSGANTEIIAIVAAAWTGLLSVVTLAISKRLESNALIKADLRSKKIPVYEDLLNLLFSVIFNKDRTGESFPEDELKKRFAVFAEKLTIWASDEVVTAFSDFRNGSSSPEMALTTTENLFAAIRRDLGHSKSLPRGTILKLFLNDVDSVLAALQSEK